jgi:GT2 family glycosyltransferase
VADPIATPAVAALLLNWCRADLTLRCLQDLLAQAEPVLVLVLDNGSDPATVAALRAGVASLAPRPSHPAAPGAPPATRHVVELVELPANLGFTGGMNEGFRRAAAAGCAYALVLNNDLRLPADFLAPLRAVLEHDPAVAAVGPTVLHPDGTVWAQGGELGCVPNGLVLRGHGGPPASREHGPEAVPFLPCACVLFRLATVTAVGGFDDRYFMYWEDVDLCERLAARGGKVVWLPWVQVVHAAGQSSGGGRSPLRKFLMACNAVRHLRARGTLRQWLGWLLCDVLAWPLVLASGPRPALAKLRGTWAGLVGHQASAADVGRYLPPRR